MGKNYKNLLVNIVGILFVIPFYYIVEDNNIFLYVLSYSLYLILINIFANVNITMNIKKYHELNLEYSKSKILKEAIIRILFICFIITLVVALSGVWLEKIFAVKGLFVVYLSMSLTIWVVPMINLLKNYLEAHGYKLFGEKLINIYYLINVAYLIMISYLAFRVFKLETYISISLLYTSHIFSFIIIFILIYLLVLKKKRILNFKVKKKREEVKNNYKKEVKEVFSNNLGVSITNIVRYCYYYLSIIIIYLVLVNRYGYSYEIATNVINITYFYALRLIFLIVIITMYLSRNYLKIVREDIKLIKDNKFSLNFNMFYNILLRSLFNMIIITCIISGPIWMLFFGNYDGAYIFGFVALLSLFMVFYIITMKLLLTIKNRKALIVSLIGGIIVKLISTIALMNAFYRMGYNLIYGDIISTVLSYFVSIIIGLYCINQKNKIDFLRLFETSLTIIYESIILCVTLILFTLIIPTKVDSKIMALGIISIYIVVVIIFMIVKKTLKKIK